ncbi:MAG TPA: hypothetical protein VHY08_24820 [Bacillota bacterium]|nr:hypothetical protein [Bacillota bacterium]
MSLIKDPLTIYYFAFPLCLLILTIVFLNRKEIKSLFWFGLIWGTVLTTIIIFILDNILNLVKYQHVYPFTIMNLPLFFDLAWTPAIMMFVHFMPDKKTGYPYYAYMIFFCLINAANDEVFHQIGLLKYIHWNPFFRFLISLPYFYWIAIHFQSLKAKGVFKD